MDKHIIVRVSADDRRRYQEALKKEGKTMSQICRAALERFARRVEKDAAK